MKFRFEDFLKNIIPGMIVLVGLLIIAIGYPFPSTTAGLALTMPPDAKEFSEIYLLLFLVGSYLLGYFNDALSSWGEYFLIYKPFGNPSFRLLSKPGKRIRLVQNETILAYLLAIQYPKLDAAAIEAKSKTCLTAKDKFENAKQLFKLANEIKDGNKIEGVLNKVNDFYFAYVFSRNLFFSTLICFILVVITYHAHLNWIVAISFFIILLTLNLRRRDKSYYYSRSVLLACKF